MHAHANLIYGTDKDSSFIVRYFEDFYGEIIRQKSLVLGMHTLRNATELGVGPEKSYKGDQTPSVQAGQTNILYPTAPLISPESVALPEKVIRNLLALLSSQANDSARYGGEFAAKYYKEAEFVMAALADEVFLHLEWSGKEYWEKNLLEDNLYGTHNAGESFFEKIDEFLKIRDPSRSDLAMIYLLALGLGFKGKYRTHKDGGRIQHYRRELFIFIYHRDPTLYLGTVKLFPEVYENTIEDNKITFLNEIKPWLIIYACVGVVMLMASYMVWYATTNGIDQVTSRILARSDKH